MSKGVKYVFSWIVVYFALSGLFFGLLHDFPELKWLYATIYPTEYFSKDVLIYESQTSGSGSGGRDLYYFNGTLKKFKTKKRVFANEKSMKKIWTTDGYPKNKHKIPVWYNTIDGAITVRTSEKFPKLYSIRQIDAYVNIITWILLLPCVWYIIRYQIQKRKKNS